MQTALSAPQLKVVASQVFPSMQATELYIKTRKHSIKRQKPAAQTANIDFSITMSYKRLIVHFPFNPGRLGKLHHSSRR
jgi:hypothetical protein